MATGRLSLKSLSQDLGSFRKECSEKLALQQRTITEQAAEIARLRTDLAATRERIAELEERSTVQPSTETAPSSTSPKISKSCVCTPTTPASALIAEEKDRWEQVKAKSRNKLRSPRPYAEVARSCPVVNNKFENLSLEEGELVTDDESVDDRSSQGKTAGKSVLILGDSNVRRLDGPLKNPKTRD